MNNDGSGCAWAMLLSLVLVIVVGIAISMTGLPNWDGALTWDTAATADRQATERIRITEENETERERIRENAETSRTWAIALASVAVIGGAIAGTVLIARTQAQRQPATVVYMLPPPQVARAAAMLPASDEYRPEYIDGEWRIVSPVRRDWMTVDDVRRLTG